MSAPVTRVVVVGHGMVGSRFVEELTRRADAAGLLVEVTVLGAEEYEPYNRVMLSEVVAGAVDVASITLPRGTPDRVRVLPGVAVRAVDRRARTVLTADGRSVGFDVLVLATGARARVPDLPGLAPAGGHPDDLAPVPVEALPAGVHPLRTLDDAREVVAATVNARRAVVLGGGVLGLEVACGLAARGLAVTVVHAGERPMDRQLDREAGDAVLRGLEGLGIEHRTGARAEAVVVTDGRVRGVRLHGRDGATGEVLPADLLVLTAGTVPETALAASAGLAVARGVLVGHDGATSDGSVFAVGDCAEPPEGASGLIAQGWDQARRLAELLVRRLSGDGTGDCTGDGTGTAPVGRAPVGTAVVDVVRVKARGLDVVAMGVCGPRRDADGAHRSVRLSDPTSGRHVEVVVADGVVVGATCVGAGRVATDLTTAYTRRTPVPADPAQLLVRPVPGAVPASGGEPSPTLMPDRATVCRCNGVTKGDILGCWSHGARSVEDVARGTRATTGCGGCADAVCGIVDWLRRSDGGGSGEPGGVDVPQEGTPQEGTPPTAPATAATGRAGQPGRTPVRA